jgi:integrase
VSVKRTKTGWQVDWRDADGDRHRKTFRVRSDADRHKREMLDMREKGLLPNHGNGTLRDFVPEWKNTVFPTLRANTVSGYESALRAHILPHFGDMKMQKIDQRSIQEWVGELQLQGLNAETVERQFATLSTIMKLASEYGLCRPIRRSSRSTGGIRLPKKTRRRIVPPTIEQIERLCDVVDPRFGAAGIRVAGYCGLRQSEIFGLHPSAIDFENHRIHVYRTIEHATGSLADTKNGKDRWVPMFDIVEEALREYMAAFPHPDFAFNMIGRRQASQRQNFESNHFHRDIWGPAKKMARLLDIKFHDLRHSAASIMIAAGWDAKRVQVALGHHSVAFTFDQYGHLFPSDDQNARTTLNRAIEQAITAAKEREPNERP